jgi:hypothetical protein
MTLVQFIDTIKEDLDGFRFGWGLASARGPEYPDEMPLSEWLEQLDSYLNSSDESRRRFRDTGDL